MFEKKSWNGAIHVGISIFLLLLVLEISDGADPFPVTSEPEDLKGRPGNGMVTLEWTEPSIGAFSVTHYFLYKTELGQPTLRYQVDAPYTNYVDRDVVNGKDYQYFVTAVNSLGESDPSNDVTVRPDGDLPIVNIHIPNEGGIYSMGLISVTWSGRDVTSEISNYEVRIDQEQWIDKGKLEDHQFVDVVSGGHTIQVRGTDPAGNRGYDMVNITVDLERPRVRINNPREGQFVSEDFVNITWEGMDFETSIISYEVKLNGYGTTYKSGPTYYNKTGIRTGDYTIEVIAVDLAGNEGNSRVNITVDPNDPVLLVQEPQDGSFTNSSSVRVSWLGNDDGSGIAEYFVRIDDGDWRSVGLETSTSLADLSEGMHIINVKAVDRGSLETVSNRTIYVDRTLPELHILRPSPNESFGPSRVLVEWEGEDQGSGLSHYIYRMDEGRWLTTTRTEMEYESVSHGIHRFDVAAVDKAGNMQAETVIFIMDRLRPTIIGYGPFGAGVQRPERIWMNFSEEMDARSLRISVGNLTGDLKHSGTNYTWAPDRKMEFGHSYQVSISGYDNAGNPLEFFSWTFSITDEVRVTGRVFDDNGNPITNARIVLDSGKTSLTEKDGSFNITARMGVRTIHVTKDGFKVKVIELDLSPDRNGHAGNIYLQKEERDNSFKVPGFVYDPWTYIVLFLILVILALFGFLLKDRVKEGVDMVRRKIGKNK
ncbi:MAG: carboxypeptidase regulatory-like domain-containing protein [Thermoplasmatota archaeon]